MDEKKINSEKSAKIEREMQDLSPEELEALRLKLQSIKKTKEKEKEEKHVFTKEELLERFEYSICERKIERRNTFFPLIVSLVIFIGFIVVWIVTSESSMAYGVGFGFVFAGGSIAYMIVSTKEIKALEEGMKDPLNNIDLVTHKKAWYEEALDNMSEEEREAALEKAKSYSKILGRYKKKK